MMATKSLRDIFAEIPELSALPFEAWRISPLAGLTNRSVRVSAGRLDYVLRLPGEVAGQYLSRVAELNNARLAAESKLSPPLLFADARRGIVLMSYLAGSRHLTPDDLKDTQVVSDVANLLSRLHGSGLQFQGTMAAFPIIDRYMQIGSDDRLRRLRRAAIPLQTALGTDQMAMVPSHIDPNPANVLRDADGRLVLIDWEFSAMCEPIWDLAAVAIEGQLDPATEDLLLLTYEAKAGKIPRQRFQMLKLALHLVAATWAKAELVAGADRPEIAALLEDRCAALEAVFAG